MDLLAEIREGGTNSVRGTLTDPKAYGGAALQSALEDLWAYDRHLEAHTDHLRKATCVADIDRAMSSRRLAIFYQLQNSTPIHKEVDRLDLLYALGLRSV